MSFRSAAQVRHEFIDFFVQRHGHAFVPSSPVVPHDDPTLLFANAGMNQFKDVFLGTGTRPYTRAVNSQKCIRAGGKHNDLDDVGKDSYHHTFFEMLGNWSFGDYFKAEAIAWAWELLTQVWKLDKRRLYATVFAGDAADGLPVDEEAAEIWRTRTDIDPTHISRWGRKDNFWEMGDTGPCGPCTEIHYDATPDLSGGPLVNKGDDRVIEIWNNVFIQFNRDASGKLTPLPARHVDTGMGFERITRVLQGKSSNYDIDLWAPIFMAVEQRSGARGYRGRFDDPVDTAYRVIADHIRTLTFAITDGAVPGNDGRGYVLRRILRRAARYGRQTLGVNGSFLHHLVPSVVATMGEAFPELRQNPQHVMDVIRDEEESFGRTLDRGLALFNDAASAARLAVHPDGRMTSTPTGTPCIPADVAFKLHDTFGFPIDLTQQMAEERGMTVDLPGYEALMEEARDKARAAATKGKAGAEIALGGEHVARLKRLGIEPTEDVDKFHGRPISARIKAIFNGTDFDNHTPPPGAGHLVALITNRTNFYAEMGGQVGDTGLIADNRGGEFEVLDTRAFGGYVLHIGNVTRGRFDLNETVQLEVSADRRGPIMANHTGTHLLNLALRDVLGPHVDQKGSLVAPDRLRFDYSHGAAATVQEIERITTHVRRRIDQDLPVYAEAAPLEMARSINGLRAVFGERYPDPVRVVSIGKPVGELLRDPANPLWADLSIEFCGGTHVPSTREIGAFAVVAEEAVAKGVRRIIALTGGAAVEAAVVARQIGGMLDELSKVDADILPVRLAEIVEQLNDANVPLVEKAALRQRVEQWQQKIKDLKRQAGKAGREAVVEQARALAEAAPSYERGRLIVAEIQGATPETLRVAADTIRAKRPEVALLLVSADAEAGKVAIIAAVPEDLIAKGLKAGDWVREAAKACGGSGGGKPDLAQAGGKDVAKVGEALAAARTFADARVGGG